MSRVEKQSTEIKLPVPWGHIAAKVYGPPKKTKILVVHGILDNAGSFDRLIKLLPEEPQYVCIDLPGHGLSSPFPAGVPLKFFDYVYVISLVLDALNWKTCIYLAHSFGAQIGIYFSILFPGRIEKLICIDGLLPNPVNNLRSYIQSLYDLKSYAKTSETLYTKDVVMYALKFKRNEALNTAAAEAMFPRAVTEVNGLYKYNRDTKLRLIPAPIFNMNQHREVLSTFATEILVIVAENAKAANVTTEMIKGLFPFVKGKYKCEAVFVQGNHDVHNNYPERVAPHICKFLNDDLKSKL